DDLTGFRLEYDGRDMLGSDEPGYRVLAGGIDGVNTTEPQRSPALTSTLVMRRLAEAAADYAVDRELGDEGAERRLLTHVTADSEPGSEEFTAEIEDLHWRLYGVRPDA